VYIIGLVSLINTLCRQLGETREASVSRKLFGKEPKCTKTKLADFGRDYFSDQDDWTKYAIKKLGKS
jgi:hypothetical protein